MQVRPRTFSSCEPSNRIESITADRSKEPLESFSSCEPSNRIESNVNMYVDMLSRLTFSSCEPSNRIERIVNNETGVELSAFQ